MTVIDLQTDQTASNILGQKLRLGVLKGEAPWSLSSSSCCGSNGLGCGTCIPQARTFTANIRQHPPTDGPRIPEKQVLTSK